MLHSSPNIGYTISSLLFRVDWDSIIQTRLVPFQPTFGDNVIALSTMLSTGATLILAFATFKALQNSNEQLSKSIKENRRIGDKDKETWQLFGQ